MQSREVRHSFFEFFRKRGHKIVRSAPVVPAEDPTLLFTNAGMNQFKDVFVGTGTREYKRAVNSQKCIRVSGKHNDLEDVGVDTSHHTFFEMLGNWSFGDYYKKEIIEWAWQLLTDVWKLDKERIYASVYLEDDEAEKLWYEMTDIGSGKVYRFGKEENFWEMGETGPCGPCSEIHYDLGKSLACGPDCKFGCECGRFQELWNLVFIQFNREKDGSLVELPKKHVDTGMGFERITAILQNKRSNYDTDLFKPLLDTVADITGVEYQEENYIGVAFRVVCDHIRALTFALADGVLPSNEGRGYVLRRILRRASRYSRKLNINEPFMYKLVSPLVDTMGDDFPEIAEQANYITKVIKSEEEGFGKTLDRGIEIFRKTAEKAKKSGAMSISGSDAFKLYDTYGFPLDLTQLMAREQNLDVLVDEFDTEMNAQKKRSSGKKMVAVDVRDGSSGVGTQFRFDTESLETSLAAMYDKEGKEIHNAGEGLEIEILLAKETPFYAEAGGQVGDTGKLESPDGKSVVEIFDTQKSAENAIFHYGRVVKGNIKAGDTVTAAIDSRRRLDIKRNHTATHLLHKALRDVLGTHVKQAGSLVAPDHLRFDFNHYQKMTQDELDRVEQMVNDSIRCNYSVIPEENVSFDEAKKKGAMALFGEKYGDRVRMVNIADYSIELCGGTHMDTTGDIGEFRIISESASAAGIRRIVAETGDCARQRSRNEREQLKTVKLMLNAQDSDVVEKLENLFTELKDTGKNLRTLRQKSSSGELEKMIEDAKRESSPPLVAHRVSVSTMDELKEYGDIIRGKMPEGAALIGSQIDKKALLVCVVGDELIKQKNWNASVMITELSKSIGGGGGGRQHMATAGIKDAGKIDDAFKKFPDIAELLYGGSNVTN